MKAFLNSFRFAYNGLKIALQQRNMKIHVCAALLVVVFSFYFKISHTEWAIILLCMGGVLSAEVFNTAIEKIADFIQPNRDEKIKVIKDLAAAAVLVFAIITVLVAGLIFIPKIIILWF